MIDHPKADSDPRDTVRAAALAGALAVAACFGAAATFAGQPAAASEATQVERAR
ncbi:hypothetical protein [Pelagerythrobacter aerophilus]|uniref:hypothetical protein n=1 Tax=Pelagerythrobacter aerophilus TaxID=2306995 RepID=UPI00160134DE|nr:hypothetical protein [Pelagerythrobacter aerophilus]